MAGYPRALFPALDSEVKIDLRHLRWIFLGLYCAIVIGLLAIAYIDALPSWLVPMEGLAGNLFWTIVILLITVSSQALFVFSAGTIDLCRPIRRRRILVPIIIASLMITVLVAAVFVSLIELFKVDDEDSVSWIFWLIVGIAWVGWSVVFFRRYKDVERYAMAKGLISAILGGSLLELLVTIPSHIIVSRRPGCLVGLLTACGITGGIAVMLWSFGPGIVLLFLRERRKKELELN